MLFGKGCKACHQQQFMIVRLDQTFLWRSFRCQIYTWGCWRMSKNLARNEIPKSHEPISCATLGSWHPSIWFPLWSTIWLRVFWRRAGFFDNDVFSGWWGIARSANIGLRLYMGDRLWQDGIAPHALFIRCIKKISAINSKKGRRVGWVQMFGSLLTSWLRCHVESAQYAWLSSAEIRRLENHF